MSSSLILQRLSINNNNPEVLNKPEEFLGPNYKEVLKFWNKIEKMSEEQWRVVKERDDALCNENYLDWLKAVDLACEASWEVVGEHYTYYAGYAAYVVTNSYAAGYATRELIGGVENPVFLKMFDNL